MPVFAVTTLTDEAKFLTQGSGELLLRCVSGNRDPVCYHEE